MKKCAALNRVYRVIWNRARGVWVAVSEAAVGPGKSNGRRRLSLKGLLLLVSTALFSPLALAAPTGGQVVSGSGTISQSGSTTTIHQASQNLSLNWKTFNVATSETVDFKQPNVSALAVNRIFDTHGSQIMGHLNANGQVWLINPNGILFGKGAQVNVGGIIASTLDTTDGKTFSGKGSGSVVNEGTINASKYVALLANTVSNSGVITARLGTVAMGAGNQVSLTFAGNSLVKLQVDKSVVDTLVANHGLIKADGGLVVMTAGAKDAILASVVNNDGIVEAQTVESHNGTIQLLGGMQNGTVNVGGTLDASAPNGGNGGQIETSAAHVEVANDAKVTTAAADGLDGSWLIDPINDFTIAATGGDISGATLSGNLSGGDITILSSAGGTAGSGDIFVNDAVSWSADTKLTLSAYRNIDINQSITATGTGNNGDASTQRLVLAYNQGGGGGSYTVNAPVNLPSGQRFSTDNNGTVTDFTVIDSLGTSTSSGDGTLQGMVGGLSGHYALGANIDASPTSGWNSGAGFMPVGTFSGTSFTGSFDGLGHTISGLTINGPVNTFGIGLFGVTDGATIENVGLVGDSVSGDTWVGGLVGEKINGTVSDSYATGSVAGSGKDIGGLAGYNNGGTISNSYATGGVSGMSTLVDKVGGLVGENNSGTISDSYATGSVSGSGDYVGGLVGFINTGGTVSDSYATGSVSGSGYYVGGLAGFAANGTISGSYATGSVTGSGNYVGGLVGYGYTGTVSDSYAIGSVTGSGNDVGGLVGDNYSSAISNSYATGSVSGSGNAAGGLVGYAHGSTISNAYATGSVTGSGNGTGGLVGYNDQSSTISDSYATGSVSGVTQVGGLVGDNNYLSTVSDSYATGNVTGTNDVGGLVGYIYNGTVSNTYAIGMVSGSTYVGGLVGTIDRVGTVSNGYWNKDTTGQTTSAGSSSSNGLTTAQMQDSSNFSGWTFTTVAGTPDEWVIVNADGSLNGNGTPGGGTLPMLASEYSTTVNNAHQLQLMAMDLTANYTQGMNIDATATAATASDVWLGGSFVPIGNLLSKFTGSFDGQGYTISNLTIDLPSSVYVGLIGYNGATISNAGLVGGSVTGGYDVGGLVGYNYGTVSNSYNTGSVTGNGYVGGLVAFNTGSVNYGYATGSVSGSVKDVGGLVGANFGGTISDSYATGSVSGSSYVGGLVGLNKGQIISVYATGSVTGSGYVGGLVGYNNAGLVNYGYAIGSVTGINYVGGLVGSNYGGTISDSYATGAVAGVYGVGGLAGVNSGAVDESYATGSVSGFYGVGGLVGGSYGTIIDSYAIGMVSSGSYIGGGLVGYNGGTIIDGYWDSSTNAFGMYGIGFDTGISGPTNTDAMPLTTAQMQDSSNFSGWTFTPTPGTPDAWVIVNADGSLNDAGTPGGGTLPMLAIEYSTTVNNAHQLQLMQMDPTASYTQGMNIDATATNGLVSDVWLGGTFVPVGNKNIVKFSGSFDGQGYTIGNLTIDLPSQDNVGLFGYTDSATISNAGLLGGSVTGNDFVGGLVGYGSASTISNSYNTGSVSASTSDVGGLVGFNLNGTISNDYATGSVSDSGSSAGGLVGFNSGGTVSDSYATGRVSGSAIVGGLVGYNAGSVNYGYAIGLVTGGGSLGGLVGINGGTVGYGYWDKDTTGQTTSAGSSSSNGLTTAQMQDPTNFTGFNFTTTPGATGNNWVIVNADGSLNDAGTPGGGTLPMLASEYSTTVNNAHQLQLMAMDLTANYTLGANIDATATASTVSNVWLGGSFVPVGTYSTPFTGSFYGANHTISNLTIDLPSQDNVGLFGYAMSGATISNVGLADASVTGRSSVGGLVGANYGTISGSYVTGSVTGSDGSGVGGLVGYGYSGTVSNSYASAVVSGGYWVGGLVGNSDGGTISGSHATGSVTGSGNFVGGLAGLVTNGTISDSYATGSVTGSGNFVGGLVGDAYGSTISNSHATGSVSGDRDVGGLVGYGGYSTISNSYATGMVSSGKGYVGGLVGFASSATISDSYATGSVTGGTASSDVGGLVGFAYGGTISDVYATGLVTGTAAVGGLVGLSNNSTISNGYWNSTVNHAAGTYGIGYDFGTSSATDANAMPLSTAQMQDSTNFTGFNFTTTPGATGNNWVIVNADGSLNGAGTPGGGTLPMLASEYSTTVNNAHQLQLMAMDLTANYTQGMNIDASSTSSTASDVWLGGSFVPIGTASNFTGSFDGQGHTISDLTIDLPDNNGVGLFGIVDSSALIENVGLAGGSVTGNYGVGGLAGVSYGTIIDSYTTGSVSGSDGVGGLVGANYGSIYGSHATGSVTGSNSDSTIPFSLPYGVSGGGAVGGLVGYNDSTGLIATSYATGMVNGSGSYGVNGVGGLVGINYGSIYGVHATGSVSGSGTQYGTYGVGGLIGVNYGSSASVSYGYATGPVSGSDYVGGLIGVNYGGSIAYGHATGSVSGTGFAVGGLVGLNDGASIYGSYATGPVSGGLDVGGLVGWSQGTIIDSYATGSVTGSGYEVGGLVGDNKGDISNSYATGNVTGSGFAVGGLVGYGYGSGTISDSFATGNVAGGYDVGGLVGYGGNTLIIDSYANGNVVAGGYEVGGLVGDNRGTISDSYATGSVSGSSYDAGGLVGYNYSGGTISDSYATGPVSGSTYVGGLVGYNDGTVNYVYAIGMVTGGSQVGGLVGHNGGTVGYGYWDTTNSGTTDGIGGGTNSGGSNTNIDVGLTTTQMQDSSNFSGWTFTSTPYIPDAWVIVNADGSLNDAGTPGGGTLPMLASEYSTTVNNAHQLQLMEMDLTASYTQGMNIDATATNGTASDVWLGGSFVPIGNSTPFTGSFDGQGYTISNLTIDLPSQDNVGLFGYTDGATISNVGLLGGSVTGGNYFTGGLVGYGSASTVSNSYNTGTVSGSEKVGGLVGYNGGTISNDYATGTVSGVYRVGGLVGVNYGTISDSYNTGTVSGSQEVGGLVGFNSGSVNYGYATGMVSGGSIVGGLVGYNFGSGTISNGYWNSSVNNAAGMYGIGSSSSNIGAAPLSTAEMQNPNNFSGFNFTTTRGATGNNWVIIDSTGTVNGTAGGGTLPMLASEYSTTVNNAHQLQLMAMDLTANYTLGMNIDATATNGTASDVWLGGTFVPVGTFTSMFTGSFHGQDHTISNLTIDLPSNNGVGLFGVAGSSALIQNVGLLGDSVTGRSSVGGLAGASYGTVSGSYATGSVYGKGSSNGAGGLVGFNYGTVSNSYASGSVTGSFGAGGLVGYGSGGTISDSYATGTVTGFYGVGGLAGVSYGGTISNSYATGTVTGFYAVGGLAGATGYGSTISGSYATGSVTGGYGVGGLVGISYGGTISDSYATGMVIGQLGVGGLAGIVYSGTISNSYATGPVAGIGYGYGGVYGGYAVGGLVGGIIFGTISDSYATGSVTGGSAVGGLVGLGYGTVSNSYATGSVAGSNYIGGLVGSGGGTISDSYATGSVAGVYEVGGLLGSSSGTVSDSYATGSVSGSGKDIGGLVGDNTGSVDYVYATGMVSGSNDVGGLVGANSGTVGYGYAIGMVTGGSYTGGLVGYNSGTVSDGYWNNTVNNAAGTYGIGYNYGTSVPTDTGAAPLSTTAMQDWSNFAGWTFTTTPGTADAWVIVNADGSLNGNGTPGGGTLPMLASEYSTTVNNAHQLQLMAMDPTASYTQRMNIDATATNGTVSDVWLGGSFVPIGNATTKFIGSFDGQGYTISNLTIDLPGNNGVGLFGVAGSGYLIQNAGLLGGSVTGNNGVGGLVGYGSAGTVSGSYNTGMVTGGSNTGGLVGYGYNSTVSNSYATGSVYGSGDEVGGLVGEINNGTVSDSYATGMVTGGSYTGGLVGYSNFGTVSNDYATGMVSGSLDVGGLVGYNTSGSMVSDVYAIGMVAGNTNYGGLVGYNSGTVSNGYWDNTVNNTAGMYGIGGGTSGATDTGAAPLSTTAMQDSSSFGGFNFTTTPGATGNNWVIVNADGSLNGNGTPGGGTLPMLASEYSTTVSNAHQLQLMAMDLTASYTQGMNIDATATNGLVSDVWLGGTFVPVASGLPFIGSFDGQGYTISNLTIDPVSNVGLFGTVGYTGMLSNVGLVGGSVTGSGNNIGGLAGTNYGTITNSYNTGNVYGSSTSDNVGGLVGLNHGAVSDSYTTGTVTGGSDVGGLVGENAGMVSTSFATGSMYGASIYVGGLVGLNYGAVSDGYATGPVTGSDYTGGLVGSNYGGTISDTYAAGKVSSGGIYVGGLVGDNSGTVSNSFYNSSVNSSMNGVGGSADVAGSVWGMSTADMMQQANFTSATSANGNVDPGWDFSNTWIIYDGYTYPLLRGFMTPLVVSANSDSKTYDGLAYSGGNGVVYSSTPDSNLLGTVSYSGSSQGAIDAGSYVITPGGLYSNQQGYILIYASGVLTVNKANLTLSGSKVYDGTTTMPGSDLTATGVHGETFAVSGSGDASNLTSADVQTGSTLNSVTGLSLGSSGNGGKASNYNSLSTDGSSVDVTPATLSATGTQVYNGTTTFYGSNLTVTGVNGETFTVTSGNGTLSSKNVQTNQPLADTSSLTLSGNSGAKTSNYYALAPADTSVSVTQAGLTISGITASDKTYDGTTTATVNTSGAVYTGLYSGDAVTVSATGAFVDKNVGTNKTVNLTSTYSGADVGNYTITDQATTTASITAATLTYMADATFSYSGETPIVSGTVTGFAPGDTLANATTGTLSWTTPATWMSSPGSYAINGSGLTANFGNYNFVQAAGNATALTVLPGLSPLDVIELQSTEDLTFWQYLLSEYSKHYGGDFTKLYLKILNGGILLPSDLL